MPAKGAGPDSTAARRRDRMLLALTFAAGCVDALSYLGLGRVFTANMTGNAVLLGLAIGQTQELQVAHTAAALAGFVLGVVSGAKVVGPIRERVVWSRDITLALALECVVLFVFAAGWWFIGRDSRGAPLISLIVLSGLAMGIQSAIARRLAVPGVSTTYVTGTITALVAELTSVTGAAGDRRRMALVIGAMIAGAVVGGLAQAYVHPVAAFVPMVVVAAVLVVLRTLRRAR